MFRFLVVQKHKRAGLPRWLVASLVGLFALIGGGAASADTWYEHYEQAETALAAEDWPGAVEELLAALEKRASSGLRVRTYGMRVIDYLPYLKLGIAYHQLGQYDAALEAFETEERLGFISRSTTAQAELDSYRTAALAQKRATQSAVEDRTAQIVEQSLDDAAELEQAGRLDDAMVVLGRGLAVRPDDPDLVARMERLREQAAQAQIRRRREQELDQLFEDAQRLVADGRLESAAAKLRELIAQRPSAQAREYLDQVQRDLLRSIEVSARRDRAASALAQARVDEQAGRFEAALESLELVLAIEPGNAEAGALRQRLLTQQAAEQERSRLADLAAGGLAQAETAFAAGRFDEALAIANQVLAIEPGRSEAIEAVRRAYSELGRRLLSSSALRGISPTIRFTERRQDRNGVYAQWVDRPAIELAGVAIGGSPVSVTLTKTADGGRSGERSVERVIASQAAGETFLTQFRVEVDDLQPGLTTYRVRATDSAGVVAEEDYAVIYRRPWFRAPWVALAALAVLVLSIAGWLGRRARRQRRLRQRRTNPFIAGGPVFDERLFFGREPLLRRLLQSIHNNSTLLYGERRIGKTSILHQLRRRLERIDDPDFVFFPVYVDLQGTPEEKFFAFLADQIFDTLGPVLGQASDSSDRSAAQTRTEGYDHHDLVRELHGAIRQLRKQNRKQVKIVLLIDEVDELNSYDPRVNQKLRSLFMKRFAESLVAVVAGVQIRKEWEKEGSPWYNFFEEIKVHSISVEEARELVLAPMRGLFRVEPGVAQRIVTEAEARPFQIQRRCLALVNRLYENDRRSLTLDDLDRWPPAESDAATASVSEDDS